eukprot:5773876-Pleurochrysis_carterae.AAC.1
MEPHYQRCVRFNGHQSTVLSYKVTSAISSTKEGKMRPSIRLGAQHLRGCAQLHAVLLFWIISD